MAGLVLQTMVLTRVDSQNALEREIQARDVQAFLTRTEDGNLDLPAVKYYHTVSRPLTTDTSDVIHLSKNLPRLHFDWIWGYIGPPPQ